MSLIIDRRKDGRGVTGIPSTAVNLKRKQFINKYAWVFADCQDAVERAGSLWDTYNRPDMPPEHTESV